MQENIDVLESLLNNDINSLKIIDENLFSLENRLKRKLDAGVSSDEFEKLNAIYQAAVSSRNLFNELTV